MYTVLIFRAPAVLWHLWEGAWILPHTLYCGLEKQKQSYLVNQKDVEGNHSPHQYSLA